jgi:sugar transferase (PEP-CTERM/EpsH1 system associated)
MERPLIAHVVHRLAVGGLENGVVNLVNRMPEGAWRHAIVALTDVDRDFSARVRRDDVTFVALHKPPGHLFGLYPALFRIFRELRPAIVHTRNLAALEATVPAWAAGVPVRIHGEHGWGATDPDGSRHRYRLVRRLYRPFVHRYVALSEHLASYLRERVGVPAERVERICNGVDTARFAPPAGARAAIAGCAFTGPDLWLVGTVGRMDAVKDQASLARAFVRALALDPAAARRLRLVMVGDGPLRPEVEAILSAAGRRELAWLPGERSDVPEVLRGLDCFVLPSLAEGISNTILEAMATRLPVVATRVGGNAELVEDRLTGRLVPSADSEALARAILDYFHEPATARRHGGAGRSLVERRFSLDRMVADYARLYEAALSGRKPAPARLDAA